MKRIAIILSFLAISCDTGNLEIITDVPSVLKEVSGIAPNTDNTLIWMINDSGNKPILYGVEESGKIKKQIRINANNRDWEDLTTDSQGNIYIGNFGNNSNDRKNLSILKILNKGLDSIDEITPEIIRFSYPDQKKFPPKTSKKHFDCESFFYFNDSLYLFTKSRTSKNLGLTNLYKIPAQSGTYTAEYISSFTSCDDYGCWITSADINAEKNKVVLLTEHSVFIFTDFKGDNFLGGQVSRLLFDHLSQKESVFFKNDSTLYIADERASARGGNLYKFRIN